MVREAGNRRREITEGDFQRLFPRLVALFRRKGASLETARDLAQTTLLEVHKSLASFEERSAFDTWVLGIAKKVWLHHLRDTKREKRDGKEVALETAEAVPVRDQSVASSEERAIWRDLIRRAGEILTALPEQMRQAFQLHVVDGLKYRHIAVLLGISENRVSSLIYQARQKLRQALRE